MKLQKNQIQRSGRIRARATVGRRHQFGEVVTGYTLLVAIGREGGGGIFPT